MTYEGENPGGCHGRRGPSLRRVLRPGRDDRGAALTEMALVLPLLLLLILGMIDFGKAINYWIDNTHLANEGARFAVVNGNPGGATRLQDYLIGQTESPEQRGGLAGGAQGTQRTAHHVNVYVCYYSGTTGNRISSGTPVVGDTVEVIVQYNYDWLRGFPFPGNPTTSIGGKAAMRLEAAPTFTGWSDDMGTSSCPTSA